MNQASDAAEQIVKMSLGATEIAVKLTGNAAIKVATLIAAALRDPKKTKGKTRLINLLKSEKDLKQFCTETKRYGVLYCVLKDKKATDGLVDIMVKADDAAKLNRIFERIQRAGINMDDLTTKIQQEQQQGDKAAPEQTQTQEKEDAFLDLLMAKAPNAQEQEMENPTMGQMKKSNPSGTTSKTSKSFGGDGEHRPSVREQMKQIRKDLEAGRTTKGKETDRTPQPKVPDSRVAWCACFVSWCADQCGYIEAGIIPKFAGCGIGADWFIQRGQWADRNYIPQPGDIIFFDWASNGQDGSRDHVGLVEKCENGYVYTVEGNITDSCVQRRYPIGWYEIVGYGLPAYP